MTPSQKARLAGIKASLVFRGRTVSTGTDLISVPCLIEKRDPSAYDDQFSKETRRESIICILKTDLSRVPKVGEFWTADDGTLHRIIVLQNDSADLLYRFVCEASSAV